jgi:uncharacterized damage-inducible protein DinB
MPVPPNEALTEIRDVLLETYAINDVMNQLLLENLDHRAWRAQLPGSKGRTIAALFAHIHNVRCKWLRLSAPHLKPPPLLDRARCTQKQARQALSRSAALCSRMLAEALAPRGLVKKFHRDGWARPWPAGAAMFSYMFSHEAHHRGQILMLAHQLGYPMHEAMYGIWQWEKLWKQAGLTTRPR